MEHSDEILDVVNTGEVPLNIKSVRIALRFDTNANVTDKPQRMITGGMLTKRKLQDTNRILQEISLRSAGVVNPRASKALRIVYVPSAEYADHMSFSMLNPKTFSGIMSELNAKSDGLSRIPVVCEYIITYAYISQYTPKADQTLKVTANCRSIGRIGEKHRQNFCTKSSSKSLCNRRNGG